MEFCKNLIGSLKKEVKCKHRLNIYHSKYFQSCQLSEIATLLAVVGSAIRLRNFFVSVVFQMEIFVSLL